MLTAHQTGGKLLAAPTPAHPPRASAAAAQNGLLHTSGAGELTPLLNNRSSPHGDQALTSAAGRGFETASLRRSSHTSHLTYLKGHPNHPHASFQSISVTPQRNPIASAVTPNCLPPPAPGGH